eukprot:1259041-Rhodomonas_salina.3
MEGDGMRVWVSQCMCWVLRCLRLPDELAGSILTGSLAGATQPEARAAGSGRCQSERASKRNWIP